MDIPLLTAEVRSHCYPGTVWPMHVIILPSSSLPPSLLRPLYKLRVTYCRQTSCFLGLLALLQLSLD